MADSGEESIEQVHVLGTYISRQSAFYYAYGKTIEGIMLYTELINSIKKGDIQAVSSVSHAIGLLLERNSGIVITAVPSSKASEDRESAHGITSVAQRVASHTGNDFVALTRELSIDSQKTMATHKDRMSEERIRELSDFSVDERRIQGKTILLLDDVLTTGASMMAVRDQLLAKGAERVICLTLSKSFNVENLKSDEPLFSELSNHLRKVLLSLRIDEKLESALRGVEDVSDSLRRERQSRLLAATVSDSANPAVLSRYSFRPRVDSSRESPAKDDPTHPSGGHRPSKYLKQ